MFRLLVATSLLLTVSLAARAEDDAARSFSFSVGTTAARVEAPTDPKGYDSIRCWQPGDTPVYFGGADVSPRNGYPICSSQAGATPAAGRQAASCASDVIELDASDLYAVVGPNPGAPEAPALQSIICIAVP